MPITSFPRSSQSLPIPLPNERLFVDVGQDGIFQVRYDNPSRRRNTAAQGSADAFSPSTGHLREGVPHQIRLTRGSLNNAVFINRVVLGYMHMHEGPARRYQMVPVWDFGVRTIDRERYDDAYSSCSPSTPSMAP